MKPQGTQLSLFETRSVNDPFAVRVSPRARRLTARVHVGGRVEIVVPVGVNAHAVRDFVQRFTPWIDRKVAAMRCFVAPMEPVPPTIEFAFTGEFLTVEWHRTPARKLEHAGGRIVVHAPDDSAARVLLQGWLKAAAEQRLTPRLLQLAAELKYSVSRVSIRCQRTRWGSCSTRGTVSLNCSLVFLRPEVVRYLFVHELAHTKHMNHSAAFWRLVEKLEPDCRRLDRELLAGWRTVPAWVFKN
ncbi:MAG TPA: SprT family zinc-dependent metalloprotease [Steroidobacteraceae bacterium]|nr:SprT family zinc-dependent metalloprotease [Steroidobacteraceae bacterium]